MYSAFHFDLLVHHCSIREDAFQFFAAILHCTIPHPHDTQKREVLKGRKQIRGAVDFRRTVLSTDQAHVVYATWKIPHRGESSQCCGSSAPKT